MAPARRGCFVSRTIRHSCGARAWSLALALLVVSSIARAQGEYVNCPGHLFAIGARLGWAQALAKNAGPEQDALLFEHLTAAGAHAQAANAECAPGPPPWPAFANWAQIQSGLAQIIDQYRRGISNRSQLAYTLAAWEQGMARDLAVRALGQSIVADRTCGELYLRIGAALADAQTTTQVHGRLIPDAVQRLRDARASVVTSTQINPPCRDMSRLVADIDEALRHPADNSTVTRVNDLWNMASLINRIGPPIPPVPTQVRGLNPRDCLFHFWATGSRLGWAEAIARFGNGASDPVMFQHLAAAGQHIRAANRACAQEPPPWPAFPNWQQLQGQLDQLVSMFQRGLMTRWQLANAIRALRDALAGQLAFRNEGGTVVRAHTCEELTLLMGGWLGYAQTTTQIHGTLVPEAVSALQTARQLATLSQQLIPPCDDVSGLLAAIDRALNVPRNVNAVREVDAAWTTGATIWSAASPSWPVDPGPTPTPVPPRVAPGLTATGGLDPTIVGQKNARLLNDFRYQASSYEAGAVTLQVTAPAVAGQPYTATITSTVIHRRHLLHPQRPGEQFEEWWTVTVTLGQGQGSLDRLEGPASAVEEYRSVAPNRTDRRVYANNERWYALRQPDGSYRLTMPGIQDGIPFRLTSAPPPP